MSVKATFYMRVYNVEEWLLRRAIESVLHQTEPNFRFIIQDNGSTDGSNEILKAYAKSDNRIDLFRNEKNNKFTIEEFEVRNEVFYRNVRGCNSKYFAIIDSDDFYDKKFLEKAIELAESEHADIVFGGHQQTDLTGNCYKSRLPMEMAGSVKELPEGWFKKNYSVLRTLWGKLYSAEYWDSYWKLIGIAKDFIQNGLDTYMVFCLLMASDRVAFMPEAIYTYTVRNNSLYHTDTRVERITEVEVLALKGIELAQYSGILNEKTLEFIANVYYYSVKDFFEILIKNKKIKQLESALQLLEQGQVFRLFSQKNVDFIRLKDDVYKELENEKTAIN